MAKIIALDAGHGMKTAGKRCLKSIDPNQTREWYLNDRIADRLQELLAGYECKVVRVDDTTGAKDISLSARVKTANTAKADVYVSIHHNAGINGRTGCGTVVYYYSSNSKRLIQARALYNKATSDVLLLQISNSSSNSSDKYSSCISELFCAINSKISSSMVKPPIYFWWKECEE